MRGKGAQVAKGQAHLAGKAQRLQPKGAAARYADEGSCLCEGREGSCVCEVVQRAGGEGSV